MNALRGTPLPIRAEVEEFRTAWILGWVVDKREKLVYEFSKYGLMEAGQ